MPPSDIANMDIDTLVESLTTDEAILLTAGVGFWHTHGVPRLGIPPVKVSDGPNGIRGNHFFMSTPAKCLPSATALGATFDPALIEEVGLKLLAEEAKLKAASVLLGPTCNIQRNPLGGRSFESFSEDPHLSGTIAAAYVRGLQAGGIGAAIKHFVCNDKENDRMASDSILSARALREIYLMPFMIAQRDAQPWSFMSSYNRVNGLHVSENRGLLEGVLRGEWGFDGCTMSDWFGVYSIDGAINAGLDLEMPGTNKWRTLDLMNRSIQSRKITARTVKERAAKVVRLVQKCAQGAPEILDGDGVERTTDNPSQRALMRKLAAESIVLLKNTSALLPLSPEKLKGKRVAVVGGNARARVLSGGGSASLKPSYFSSAWDGLVEGLGPDVEVVYCEGAPAYMTKPSLDFEMLTPAGERGWLGTWHAHENDESMTPLGAVLETMVVDETRMFIGTSIPKGITRRWTMKLTGQLKPRAYDRNFEFGMAVAGRAKLWVDEKLVIDNWTTQRRGEEFFNSASTEAVGAFVIKANHTPKIYVEFCNVRSPAPADGDLDEAVMDTNPGLRLGGAEVLDEDAEMARAVALARDADLVVAVIGLNADWETEGYDRTTLALPRRTDELIFKVAEANARTVVVTQAGSAIVMPWADRVSTIVHSWYLGNATGEAIADVLLGKKNPCGRLSLSFPKRMEDLPSHGHFGQENGKVRYGEDLFVGYKHYVHRSIATLFPFGHGLSYTTFEYSWFELTAPKVANGNIEVTASVIVTNTGALTGSDVVQLYISMPVASHLTHPPIMLKAFDKVRDLAPGKSAKVTLRLDKYAVSYWEERIERWSVDAGEYIVRVGSSSESLPLSASFKVTKGFEWSGL
ncbi:glycoside hydrolase family 3 protein [Athelia psychrophila]|uniref:beta-glucosidase n=1 Tax=Athelia psychrophila TaxID=1759441 RepID=A0A166ETL8_9AGAM|nr:glycoside hydrolase family 3 protein [Fibularhizoctonia sp. CBS 109695]